MPHLFSFIMFKECSSGVRNPNLGEMKGRRLTLAKDSYIKIYFMGDLKAPKMVLSKVLKF